jgi:hypothetical protein
MRGMKAFVILGLLLGFGGFLICEPNRFSSPSIAVGLIWLLADYAFFMRESNGKD